jgi:hypothetical protein
MVRSRNAFYGYGPPTHGMPWIPGLKYNTPPPNGVRDSSEPMSLAVKPPLASGAPARRFLRSTRDRVGGARLSGWKSEPKRGKLPKEGRARRAAAVRKYSGSI